MLCAIVTEIGEFQTVVGGFITIVDRLAKQVEQEKMKVINYNCRNIVQYTSSHYILPQGKPIQVLYTLAFSTEIQLGMSSSVT